MSLLHQLRRRLFSFFRRKKIETEMAEEMNFHLAMRAEDKVADGLSDQEARYAAQRKFGNVGVIQETARDHRSFVWFEQFIQDVRFAARGLHKNLGFTFVSVVTIALGIGVNTSMFTALQSVLMRPLPYPDAERLVQVFRTSSHSQRWPHSPTNFLDQQARNTVFERMAAVNGKPFNLAEPGKPAERVRGLQSSVDLFPLLGIQPAFGRTFLVEEDQPGRNTVIVLSHGFWLRRFAGDPAVIGRAVRLDGESVTVVGVMPAHFSDKMLFGPIDVWRPIAFTDEQRHNRSGNFLKTIARLKPGVSVSRAQVEMNILAANQASDAPETNSGVGLNVVPLRDAVDPRGRTIMWLTMILAGFVLLIACANLANLQFARTSRRQHELAIRGAVGASRQRLLRQLVTESLLIAFLGGLLGLLLAVWGNHLLSSQLEVDGERVLELPLNLLVLGFTLAASTTSGLAFGLVPAWRASRIDVNLALKQGSRGTFGDRSQYRLQHALIVGEVALALVLLAGAGLVIRGLQRHKVQHPGWEVKDLSMGYLSLPGSKYGSDEVTGIFVDRLQEKLAGLPGVERVAIAWSLPLSGFNTTSDFTISGRPGWPEGRAPIRFVNGVTPGYFETLRMQFVSGRDFTSTDSADHPQVVIINKAMAEAFWPGESPLHQQLNGEEIIGVVNDVRFPADPSEQNTRYQTYRPLAQGPRAYLAIVLRGKVTDEGLRRAVAELDPDLPVSQAGRINAAIEATLGNFAVGGWVLSGFALLGLLLASLGIYGVIAGFVVQRTQEIGVRMALGAQIWGILWLVVKKGLQLTLLGTALGLAGAIGIARLFVSILPGLEPNDPLLIAGVASLLIAVGVLACWLPARRAARVDPLLALRAE